MTYSKKAFLDSLDLTDQEIEAYIPFILEDLWELGSMPGYIIRLIEKNISPSAIHTVTDFGCGKGAVLIKLALERKFNGLGIDIIPAFIQSARRYAAAFNLSDRLTFQNGDVTEVIKSTHNNDLVIYGYDSGLLGNITESLLHLKKCIHAQGWILLEMAYTSGRINKIEGLPTAREVYRQIQNSGLIRIDKIIWNKHEIRKINTRNNALILPRIQALQTRHPHMAQIFERYMENQLAECRLLENEIICSTWLLKA